MLQLLDESLLIAYVLRRWAAGTQVGWLPRLSIRMVATRKFHYLFLRRLLGLPSDEILSRRKSSFLTSEYLPNRK